MEINERNRKYLLESGRKKSEKLRNLFEKPRRGHWSTAEDSIVIRTDISIFEKAFILQREYSSIANRLRILKLGITVKCEYCGDPFARNLDVTERRPGRYCSRICHYSAVKAATVNKYGRDCEICGKFYLPAGPGRYGSRFCSVRCSADGQSIYPKSADCACCGADFRPKMTPAGKLTRFCSRKCFHVNRSAAALTRNNKPCEMCGATFLASKKSIRFCSRDCACRNKSRIRVQMCEWCGTDYMRHNKSQRFCGKSCAMKSRLSSTQTQPGTGAQVQTQHSKEVTE